jgi:hypothetical protein
LEFSKVKAWNSSRVKGFELGILQSGVNRFEIEIFQNLEFFRGNWGKGF